MNGRGPRGQQASMSRWLVMDGCLLSGFLEDRQCSDAFGAGNGGVEVLGAATGNQLQYADLHSAATSSPAVIMSWLYVGAHDGNLYAFVRSG